MFKSVFFVNVLLMKKNLKWVIGDVIEWIDFVVMVVFFDVIKEMGFFWVFKGGLFFNLGDLIEFFVKINILEEV